MAFTDYETEQLRKALLKETRHCAVTLGMKKTSVDQLTKAVGIAKGSFYKFYESKEMVVPAQQCLSTNTGTIAVYLWLIKHIQFFILDRML